MYKVIKTFYDLQDRKEIKGGTIYQEYRPGDLYPRKGFNPSSERIAELASPYNAQGTPLIELVGDAKEAGSDAAETAGVPAYEEVEQPQKKAEKKTTRKRASKKAADQELMPGA